MKKLIIAIPFLAMSAVAMAADMRSDGGRVARAHGFSSLAEFMRFLLNAEIKKHFDQVDKVFDERSPIRDNDEAGRK